MIAIVPTAGKNLASVVAALTRLGAKPRVTEDPDEIRSSERVILPGVGHAETMMARLSRSGLVPVIRGLQQPVLGICLGMQLYFEASEETGPSQSRLLGIVPGTVRAIPNRGQSLPHIGWNRVVATPGLRVDPLVSALGGRYVYFVHSFIAPDGPWVSGQAEHEVQMPAVIRWLNFSGAQFHPERSGEAGLDFLREFLAP